MLGQFCLGRNHLDLLTHLGSSYRAEPRRNGDRPVLQEAGGTQLFLSAGLALLLRVPFLLATLVGYGLNGRLLPLVLRRTSVVREPSPPQK